MSFIISLIINNSSNNTNISNTNDNSNNDKISSINNIYKYLMLFLIKKSKILLINNTKLKAKNILKLFK